MIRMSTRATYVLVLVAGADRDVTDHLRHVLLSHL